MRLRRGCILVPLATLSVLLRHAESCRKRGLNIDLGFRDVCQLMGWSGRVPAPPTSNADEGARFKERAMSSRASGEIAVIGIDIGKNSFHIVGLDKRGAIILRQKWSRGQVETRLANIDTRPDHTLR